MHARLSTRLVRYAVFAAGLACATGASAAGAYDGVWNVTLTCPAARDGAKAYTVHFPVLVGDSVLHGDHGEPNAAGWLALDGRIEPDGSATLVAQGISNADARAARRARKGTPYSYEVSAHFDATSGSGSRTTARRCHLVFVRT
ncbi:hypothetical protein [Paraburkholderia acidisoli]|uniref:Uncharacterized protein n=1 Tax=Paraburkholderia acidisoli TaxID=2571748 RepID=A0A7Z2JIU7_9BURK|nr:hypothetical protein [Paraburkholderia acidisoli]QGZ66111.1 hypothetical protein FAZ98_30305 [Paraburkholderia acidisoli]